MKREKTCAVKAIHAGITEKRRQAAGNTVRDTAKGKAIPT